MANPEVLKSKDELQPLVMVGVEKDYFGQRKIIHKMTDGQRPLAVKKYRDRAWIGKDEFEEEIDKPMEATQEFDTYRLLRQTPLGLYVPTPRYLITEEQSIVGLAVDWIEGPTVSTSAPITKEELDMLERRVRRTRDEDRIDIHLDMVSNWNLMLQEGENEGGQRIYFAECNLYRNVHAGQQTESDYEEAFKDLGHYVR